MTTRAEDEALIKDYEKWLCDDPDMLHLCALARRGLDAVPREPEAKMIDAGRVAFGTDIGERVYRGWIAMHDAATGAKGE